MKQRFSGTEFDLAVLETGTGIITRRADGHVVVVEQRLDRLQTRRLINELQEATNTVLRTRAEAKSFA